MTIMYEKQVCPRCGGVVCVSADMDADRIFYECSGCGLVFGG